MQLRQIKNVKQLKGKKVLLRLDLDMPLGGDLVLNAGEDSRLLASLPTIKFLLKKEAQIIIVGHMGRPQGQIVNELKLKPVAVHLAKLLGVNTSISCEKVGAFDAYMFRVNDLEVYMLENIRFLPGEKLSSKPLIEDLKDIADLYVNDAFAVVHRDQASVTGIAKKLPAYAGQHVCQEIDVLGKVLKRPSRPLTLIIGGVKAETKLKLIEKFIPRADYILLGSAVANNFYKKLGYEIGKSKCDDSIDAYVNSILQRPRYRILEDDDVGILLNPQDYVEMNQKKFQELHKRVILPIDIVAAPFDLVEKGKGKIDIETVDVVPGKKNIVSKDLSILDIGPKTSALYAAIIKRSKTIIWNGPMGYFENKPFDLGTNIVAKAVAASRGKGIVGGGDTIAAIESEHIDFKQNVFVSMGGGAMLEFLLNPELPGIKPLLEK